MTSTIRLIAALVLVGFVTGCAPLGIPAPSMEGRTSDPISVPDN